MIKMTNISVYLREIADEIDRGITGIPLWQRNFVWRQDQVTDLFDSIINGYPIGSFLLWSRDKDWKGSLAIMDSEINDAATPRYYILDGRQRLTAFYGCTIQSKDKPSIFDLYYNLRLQSFVYVANRQVPSYVLRVSDIYDTFTLLGKLQKIRESYDEETARKYVELAKRVNYQLQQYVVSKITLEDCSLDDAVVAFSRLNSKGTDISKTEMVQALCFKGDKEKLLIPAFRNIARSLEPYGFDGISNDEILSFHLMMDNRNFLNPTLKELETARTVLVHKDKVNQILLDAVRFLSLQCGVCSYSLLPYKRQLLFLFSFFRTRKLEDLTEKEIRELTKWFFYTTLNLLFQNNSVNYLKRMYSDFSQFSSGKSDSPISYKGDLVFTEEQFDFTVRSARFKLMMICLIGHYKDVMKDAGREGSGIRYIGYDHFWGSKPQNYFPLFEDGGKGDNGRVLSEIFSRRATNVPEYVYKANLLDKKILTANTATSERGELLFAQRKSQILALINARLFAL